MFIFWKAVRGIFQIPGVRQCAHKLFMGAGASLDSRHVDRSTQLRVLVLGVYLSDRPNTAAHLARAFASEPNLDVEQRWVSIGAARKDNGLQGVTWFEVHRSTPKFALINRLIDGTDLEQFDYVLVVDDDIHVQPGFLRAFLGLQRKFGFALAQPARAWHSFFDHSFVLRRGWLAARQTRFVECGPLVSFSREAVRLLLPFHAESEMWGMDLVWPIAVEKAGLSMGIIDAIAVDHSLRGQATTYDRSGELAAMSQFLACTPHIAESEVFDVRKRYRAAWYPRYF